MSGLLLALLAGIPEDYTPPLVIVVVVALLGVVSAFRPEHLAVSIAMGVVIVWWALQLRSEMPVAVLVVAAGLVLTHVAATLLGYGPPSLAVDPALALLWTMRGAMTWTAGLAGVGGGAGLHRARVAGDLLADRPRRRARGGRRGRGRDPDPRQGGSTMSLDHEQYVELVLSCVEQIPRGRVSTYGAIAEVVGQVARGGGPRLVGSVMAQHGGAVPWWRVVRANGSLPPSHDVDARPYYLEEGTPLRPTGNVDIKKAFWRPPALGSGPRAG